MIYLAFHNNADLQAEVLAEVRQHVAADRVIQGTYGDEHGACFIGCLANGEIYRPIYFILSHFLRRVCARAALVRKRHFAQP